MHCLLEFIILLPQDFFEQHGEEMMSIVFKLTFYNHLGMFEDEKPPSENVPTEAKINYAVHQVISKIILTPKSEEQSQKLLISLGEIIYS